jgi:hypothetical protein
MKPHLILALHTVAERSQVVIPRHHSLAGVPAPVSMILLAFGAACVITFFRWPPSTFPALGLGFHGLGQVWDRLAPVYKHKFRLGQAAT